VTKYNSKKTKYNGILFDSKKEAKRYRELLLLEKAGKITDLELQKAYELIPAQYATSDEVYTKGKNKGQPKRGALLERAVVYKADFKYVDENGYTVVEDTKGYKKGTAYSVFTIKRKLMLLNYGIQIREV
jgi:hypothetical protein